jgi:hypothetical protein
MTVLTWNDPSNKIMKSPDTTGVARDEILFWLPAVVFRHYQQSVVIPTTISRLAGKPNTSLEH